MSARPLSEFEYNKMVEFLATAGRHRDRLLLVLGCATGYRITELLSLKWEQLWDGTAARSEVQVARRNLKGGQGPRCRSVRSRRVPLNERARAAIEAYAKEVPHLTAAEAAVFQTGRSQGGAMNRSQAFRMLTGAAVDCGVGRGRLSTHTLRKTFVARVYAASGHDLIKTQRIVGHSSPLTTARYLETDQDELDELVRSLAA
ncbi:MAG: tyrosine-type recombinase/integrase [Opitutaceae bacterium]|nr:tyrosine-type recombinase/integrase [Opitutaceae bacterium]